MSNLGDRIQDEIDDIDALELGERWDSEWEAYIDAVRGALDAAAPDSIRNAAGEITADVNNQTTNSRELSVSDVLDAPSYPTQAGLPSNRPVGFIALIEEENRIYFEGA